jgi:hypothetical protein
MVRSPKMLAESMAFGKDGGHIQEPVDQPYLNEKRAGCACIAVPRSILSEDATEPKTGIKFPTLLEDNSNLTAEVFFQLSSMECFFSFLCSPLLSFNFSAS